MKTKHIIMVTVFSVFLCSIVSCSAGFLYTIWDIVPAEKPVYRDCIVEKEGRKVIVPCNEAEK